MTLPHAHIAKDGFRLRGIELARIDAFSDVVFGFALTLLVVSLEVPKTYSELHDTLRGFLPFAISFLFLMLVWYAHYKFFRRFGTHDLGTITINAVLLFVVLFYVYPLKFLFTFAVFGLLHIGRGYFDTYGQITELMVIFGLGFASIYFLLAALYWNGWRQRVSLALTPVEQILAREYIYENLLAAFVGLLSCGVARLLPPGFSPMAGWTFLLIAVFRTMIGKACRRKIARLQVLEAATVTPPVAVNPAKLKS